MITKSHHDIIGDFDDIKTSAFFGCDDLKMVTIDYGVKKIGIAAFQECTGLDNVSIPAGVETIGDHAFSGCSDLKYVAIPQGTSIGKSAFSGCSKLTVVTFEGTDKKGQVHSVNLETIGDNAFNGCIKLNHVNIPYTTQTNNLDELPGNISPYNTKIKYYDPLLVNQDEDSSDEEEV